MAPYKHSSCIRIFSHYFRHTVPKILFVGRIFDDWHFQCVQVRHGSADTALPDTFDHLYIAKIINLTGIQTLWSFYLLTDVSDCGTTALVNHSTHLMRYRKGGPCPQQSCHDGMLGVSMDTATCVAEIERAPKKRRASRLLQVKRRPPKKHAVRIGWRLRIWQHEDVAGVYALLLDARWGNVDFIAEK